jgi:NDP-sugar pyrophosphorylase family protein
MTLGKRPVLQVCSRSSFFHYPRACRPCGDRNSERDRERHHDPQLDPYGGRLLPGRSLGTKARRPTAGIGRHCRIEGAIIDKNAYIEDGVVITSEGKSENADGENYYIRDGVVVVPKDAVIPAGTSI